MSQTKTKIKKALKLIQNGWTKGSYAKTASGTEVGLSDNRACRYCAMGAWYAAGLSSHEYRDIMQPYLFKKHGIKWVVNWNDAPKRKKSEVVGLFKELIERVK